MSNEVGTLVPTDDPEALARGIEHVLDNRSTYDPAKLRAHALEKFGLDSVNQRIAELYSNALEGRFETSRQESAVALETTVTAAD